MPSPNRRGSLLRCLAGEEPGDQASEFSAGCQGWREYTQVREGGEHGPRTLLVRRLPLFSAWKGNLSSQNLKQILWRRKHRSSDRECATCQSSAWHPVFYGICPMQTAKPGLEFADCSRAPEFWRPFPVAENLVRPEVLPVSQVLHVLQFRCARRQI